MTWLTPICVIYVLLTSHRKNTKCQLRFHTTIPELLTAVV